MLLVTLFISVRKNGTGSIFHRNTEGNVPGLRKDGCLSRKLKNNRSVLAFQLDGFGTALGPNATGPARSSISCARHTDVSRTVIFLRSGSFFVLPSFDFFI